MINQVDHTQLNIHCHALLENHKASRKQARAYLLAITGNFKNIPVVEETDRFRFPQAYKVTNLLRQANEGVFPYIINEKKPGVVERYLVDQPEAQPEIGLHQASDVFIAMMAHGLLPDLESNLQRLREQIRLLQEEGFSETREESLAQAALSLRIFIGGNSFKFLTPEKNRRIKAIFHGLSQLTNGTTHLETFWIEPAFALRKHPNIEAPYKEVKRVYRCLLEGKNPKAELFETELMSHKVIPMQLIRQHILKSRLLRNTVCELLQANPNAKPVLFVCDNDADTMRTEAEKNGQNLVGLFTHYRTMIAAHPGMILGSTGYTMKKGGYNYVEAASKADLVGRIALGSFAYLPEPNFIIRLGSEPLEMLHELSFIRSESYNRGRSLEYVGLLENLKLDYSNALGKIVMGTRGAIVTDSRRVVIPKNIPKTIVADDFEKHEVVKSFRSFMQTCLDPVQFAANMLRLMPGLGGQANNGKVSKFLQLFDPIFYAKVFPNSWTYTYSEATLLLQKKIYHHHKPSALFDFAKEFETFAADNQFNETEKNAYLAFFENQFSLYKLTLHDLLRSGFNSEQINVIYRTSRDFSRLIHGYFESLAFKMEFTIEDFL